MKSRYDPSEDRILLILEAGEAEHKLWVSRRLWLALYREVAALSPDPREKADAQAPPPSKPTMPLDVADATLLHAVQLKRRGDAVALVFKSAHEPITWTLKAAGLARLKRMLEVQADRAGWDSSAAMERMGAEALAAAAVKHAKA